jgi:Flp pilus assembly protein TadD, contains TPR repeats
MNVISAILLILGLFLIASGIGAVVFVLFRRMPTVALIDVKSLPVDHAAKKKEEIIAERIIRNSIEKFEPVRKAMEHAWEWLRERFRRLAHRAFELERRSERLARKEWDALTASTRMHALAREADALAKEEKFVEAEKKYIEALSIEQKNPKFYEKLGRLYMRNKNYDQARDTLRFASRLSPNDASVVASLGEIATARSEYADAITYFQHAVSLRPRSPRYLDFLLEACIMGGNRIGAKEALAQLSTVNPENAKLAEFDKRIRGMV